ncbi:hypothetical protein E2562_009169 [Oryza meyeriana var. granulata]|uniref:Uncharacterized protein n=1 Tax=Oryza meyeriana var. granulata TaxID=110450 RepID=A0A6G1CEQ3_9ORYZ|nr:hypothetical protein E2562_009169 [Oryza meyeriana var. granulata]
MFRAEDDRPVLAREDFTCGALRLRQQASADAGGAVTPSAESASADASLAAASSARSISADAG